MIILYTLSKMFIHQLIVNSEITLVSAVFMKYSGYNIDVISFDIFIIIFEVS